MPNIRYEFDWKVNDENGDCTARVTRSVIYGLQPNPAEESKFQVQVGKHVLRIFPWPGQEVFKSLPNSEYEKFVAVAKAFYAGANKSKDFYYWELPEEDTSLIPKFVATTNIINDLPIKKKKIKYKKKKGPNDIWQTTT
jgi:hypothetical protein